MNTIYKLISFITFSLPALAMSLIASSYALAKKPQKLYIPDGYSIETIELPAKVRMHITGLDSDSDGHIYAATRFGDVWLYKNNQWFQFAEGLHEPTGLMCDKDGSILVAQKPELTRLVDTNNDDVADRYVHVASDWQFHDNYHEFNFGPVKDKKGNLYGTLNLGHDIPGAINLGVMRSAGGHRGWAYKIDKKGKLSYFASGLRSPAGLGSSPKGEIFYTDNQGDWVGTSKLHILEEGKFYGHPASLINHEKYTEEKLLKMTAEEFAQFAETPNIWIPHGEVASSPGNPEWDTTKGKFGPFKNQIFIGDQTQSNIFRVILEKVKGDYQGAVINFINGFQSGNIRTEFDKKGQLWVGQTSRGWGSKGNKPFGLQKVTWNGTMPFELLKMRLTKKGFKLYFTEALDKASVDKETLKVEQWHYRYSRDYGSPKVDLQEIAINSVKLSSNGKVLDIAMPLTPGKVVSINFSGLTSTSNRQPSSSTVYYTLNKLK